MSDKPDYLRDTIVAMATPTGVGGIGIVRISGPEVPKIARKMLGSLPAPREAVLKEFRDATGEPIDTGLALYSQANRCLNYTAMVALSSWRFLSMLLLCLAHAEHNQASFRSELFLTISLISSRLKQLLILLKALPQNQQERR